MRFSFFVSPYKNLGEHCQQTSRVSGIQVHFRLCLNAVERCLDKRFLRSSEHMEADLSGLSVQGDSSVRGRTKL
ncbi:hypothetical protein SRHO_G00080830 [Serrasalmus rhombeus]